MTLQLSPLLSIVVRKIQCVQGPTGWGMAVYKRSSFNITQLVLAGRKQITLSALNMKRVWRWRARGHGGVKGETETKGKARSIFTAMRPPSFENETYCKGWSLVFVTLNKIMNNHWCCAVSMSMLQLDVLDLDYVISDIRLNDQMNSKKQESLIFDVKSDVWSICNPQQCMFMSFLCCYNLLKNLAKTWQ